MLKYCPYYCIWTIFFRMVNPRWYDGARYGRPKLTWLKSQKDEITRPKNNAEYRKINANFYKNLRGQMLEKAEFYFGISKIRSKGNLSHSQIDLLLSKRENMAIFDEFNEFSTLWVFGLMSFSVFWKLYLTSLTEDPIHFHFHLHHWKFHKKHKYVKLSYKKGKILYLSGN